MTVQYQDFGIGRRNVTHTVAQEYTGTLGKTTQELQSDSTLIVADIMKGFNFVLFSNGYTGERNFAQDTHNPLSLVVKISDDVLVSAKGIELYEKKKSWGMSKHRNWLPMKATYVNGKTVLVQDLPTGYKYFVIENGVVTVEREIEQRSITPTPEEIAKFM